MSGFDELNARFQDAMRRIDSMSERTVTEIMITVQAYASTMTPVMTSNLINSQYREVRVTANGFEGEFGYGAKYAAYVHNKPGTLLGARKLRRPSQPRWGYVWEPSGEPEFLSKAVDLMVQNDLWNLIQQGYEA